MKFSELADMIGEMITVELVTRSSEKPFADVHGKLLAVSERGLVVESGGSPSIIELRDIADVRKGAPLRKMVRRKIATIPEARLRQHLLDRHSILWSLARVMTPATAMRVHDQINHDDLGHRHVPEGEGAEE